MLKSIIAVAVLMLCALPAQAEYLIKFKDGSAFVWKNISDNGNGEYCRYVGGGSFCVDKKDVKWIRACETGTDPSAYNEAGLGAYQIINSGGATDADASRKAVDEMNQNARERDSAANYKAQQRAYDVRRYGEKEVRAKELQGNTAKGKYDD